MPRYRIHRMKETPREAFRWAAHTGGLAIVKPKDYDFSGEIEAATLYAAWKLLTVSGSALHPGDLLETIMSDTSPGELMIAKYIGFERATWWVPEAKPESFTPVHPEAASVPNAVTEPPSTSETAHS